MDLPNFEDDCVVCFQCGREQADMGRNVACEECGARMPTELDEDWDSNDDADWEDDEDE